MDGVQLSVYVSLVRYTTNSPPGTEYSKKIYSDSQSLHLVLRTDKISSQVCVLTDAFQFLVSLSSGYLLVSSAAFISSVYLNAVPWRQLVQQLCLACKSTVRAEDEGTGKMFLGNPGIYVRTSQHGVIMQKVSSDRFIFITTDKPEGVFRLR